MKRSTIFAAILLGACGKSATPNDVPSTDIVQGASVQGPSAGSRADLVPDFPGSTPVEIPNLGAPGTDTRSGNSTASETNARPDQVATFYREHFRKAGIPIRADTANAQGGMISVARDGERGAMVTINRKGDKTRIAVMTGPR